MDIKDLFILNLLLGKSDCKCQKSQPAEEMGWGTILFIGSPFIWLYRHEILIFMFLLAVGYLVWTVSEYNRHHRLPLIVTIAVVVILGGALWMSWGHISGEWADYLKECSVVKQGNQL